MARANEPAKTLEDMLRACVMELGAKVGTVAYKQKLPEELSSVHDTFHVLNLKKCLSDETLVILVDKVCIDDKFHFIKEPVEVTDWKVQKLRRSRIKLVKVRWNSWCGRKLTWEREVQMKAKYHHLFEKIPAQDDSA
ncbi:uncharacterized protein LOC110887933 [Helianthus annuus]|uniref:uncharacterized protein LOC110887933 n=1 Tax=Helianthus annuus TaxID=4232 RepID=UPI000B8F3EBB|nr:uncharacterized protein LOC110887933 [Helianthus annuus]